ncbi:hypothetical protein MCAV_07060 [[Mycoplasma] cavipharyngis]|uniref:hypothetical protein n=1 Tax=[Mycoplasma] cavipharyngis TaxID=92757 RepID=UPI0037044BF7
MSASLIAASCSQNSVAPCNCSSKTMKENNSNINKPTLNLESIKNDPIGLKFEKFNNEIIESAYNEHPSVFISRNASQFFISSFIALVAQLQLINKQENKHPYNDVVYLIDSEVNSYQKTLNNEPQRFNFAHLLSKYGDVALKTYSQQFNVNSGKLLVLDNPKYLENYSFSDYFSDYSIFPRTEQELRAYLKPYLDNCVELFDFYIPDISYTALNKQTRDFILKHANKIVILSDGNAQPYKFINDNYINYIKNQKKHYTKEQLLQAWDSLKTDKPSQIDYHYFYTLEEKFRIYNLSGKYIQAFNDDLDKKNLSWAKINIHDYPLNYSNIAKYLNKYLSELNEKEFLDDYNKLVNLHNKKLEDLIVHGKEKLDKSKKNLIFVGSSLFRQDQGKEWRIISDTQSRSELHKYFKKILELYPSSEYNYLYKLHPVYRGEQALEYIKHFTNGHEGQAIILDPSISWENMLALDMQEIESGNSLLFDKDKKDFEKNNVKTKLFGIQPTSTVLLATLVMLQAQFNITLDQALSFVDPKNFPISDNFNIVKRDLHYKGEQGQTANRKELYSVYKYFIDTKLFPDLNQFPAMSEFLKKTKETMV